MTKIHKLIERFKAKPTDFAWDELTALLRHLEFRELQGRGSRVKFYNQHIDCLIQLHKPPPAKILKPYMLREILDILLDEKLI